MRTGKNLNQWEWVVIVLFVLWALGAYERGKEVSKTPAMTGPTVEPGDPWIPQMIRDEGFSCPATTGGTYIGPGQEGGVMFKVVCSNNLVYRVVTRKFVHCAEPWDGEQKCW